VAKKNPGGSIYIGNQIATPGAGGIMVGRGGVLLFKETVTPPPSDSHILREAGDIISTESGDLFIVE
jgi:hypothetical protein